MIVYKITNLINGKIYIGRTIRTLSFRMWQHLNIARNGGTGPLHRALLKNGLKSFLVETVATAETFEELNKLEIAFIAQFNSMSPTGYNLTSGGEGSPAKEVSYETRERMSNRKIGKLLTDEHRLRISESLCKMHEERSIRGLTALHPTKQTKSQAATIGWQRRKTLQASIQKGD